MTMSGKTIMLLIAHPDDETRSSGTLAKLVKAGNKVVIVIATNGDKGTHDASVSPIQIAETRRQEMTRTAEILGVEVVWLGFPDGSLEASPNLKEAVFRVIRQYRPNVFITFDPFKKYDEHSDHMTIGRVGFGAAYLADGCWYFPEHMIAGIESCKPQEVYLFNPEVENYTVDIRDVYQIKMEAAEAHLSQFKGKFQERMRSLVAAGRRSEEDLYHERFHKVYDSDLFL
jgi:N,N'-diacetylchitobiose non-reducing end deacetylase